ncbi:MAG TPA: hypothetical protein VK826_09870 [Bacteroidia bacterium]|nr:hypothetical protein [Bacteroidia bacterium]
MSCAVCAQSVPLTSFHETKLPAYGTGNLYDLNHSPLSFDVSNVADTLAVTRTPRSSRSPGIEFILPQGKLVGTDHGEWIGSLKFTPADTTRDSIEILRANILFIFQCEKQIYIVEGLEHMGESHGTLFRLDTLNGIFTLVTIQHFDSAPDACAVQNDSIFLLAGSALFLVHDSVKEVVGSFNFDPTSIAMTDARTMYIGMHGAYARFDLVSKQIVYFVYKEN